MNDRGLVEVPENAVRDEPIAFGLTGIQLGICGVAALFAAALNLLPVWEPIRIVLIVLGAGPVALAAALPVQGEPAYRWLIRAVRYLRGRRTWQASLIGATAVTQHPARIADKPQISGADQTAESPAEGMDEGPTWQIGDNTATTPQRASSPTGEASPDEAPGRPPPAREQVVMHWRTLRQVVAQMAGLAMTDLPAATPDREEPAEAEVLTPEPVADGPGLVVDLTPDPDVGGETDAIAS
ncbi:MAG: PrgI family protein [Chloroflexi bacterium]|nr:PrgI family protein [Chloroflexota bacterium]